MSSIAANLDEDRQILAYQQLRSVRRKNRISHLDKFDAFYKAYLSALVAAIAVYAGAGALGNRRLDPHHVHVVSSHGPAVVGVFVALAVAIGFRSGGRGGPLAFERSDVRHVLLAPIDKRVTVRRPATRQVRHTLFLGLAFGAAVGIVVGRRFPYSVALWVVVGALSGATTLLLSYGTALISGGLRIKRWLADLLAVLSLAWAGADVATNLTTSPFSWIGSIAVWPLKFRFLGILGVVVALVVVALGIGVVNRLSIEAAERRSRLIGQLRFAATLQDVRTVMVLQRQLAQEHLRSRPWIPLPRGRKIGFRGKRVSGGVFARRSLAGMLRWPLTRFIRLLILVAIAAFCVLGVWGGSSALVVVAGVALWLGALDLIEGLAQEIDHPDRLDSIPRSSGIVYLRLLVIPFVVMFLLLLIAYIAIYVLAGHRMIVSDLGPIVLTAAACAVGGAAIAVTQQPALPGGGMIETPEIASAKFVVRVVLPPAVAVAGLLPVVAAEHGWNKFHTLNGMVQSVGNTLGISMAVAIVALMWVRYRDDLKAFIKAGFAQQEAAKAQQQEKKQDIRKPANKSSGNKSSGNKSGHKNKKSSKGKR